MGLGISEKEDKLHVSCRSCARNEGMHGRARRVGASVGGDKLNVSRWTWDDTFMKEKTSKN